MTDSYTDLLTKMMNHTASDSRSERTVTYHISMDYEKHNNYQIRATIGLCSRSQQVDKALRLKDFFCQAYDIDEKSWF